MENFIQQAELLENEVFKIRSDNPKWTYLKTQVKKLLNVLKTVWF